MSKRFWYYYICEDCGEAIQQRLDTIKNMQNMRCRNCDNVHKGIENRDKISESLTDRKLTPEHCKHMAEGHMGHLTSEETRRKISNSQPYKGIHHQTNTGKTHFKRGLIPWNYKGGIGYTRGKEWISIRKQIYNRDNKTCQRCKRNDKSLQCHHIIPYSSTEDNSERNLISLCTSCHKSLEGMYTNKCNRPMYFAFINEWRNKNNIW